MSNQLKILFNIVSFVEEHKVKINILKISDLHIIINDSGVLTTIDPLNDIDFTVYLISDFYNFENFK